MKPHPAWQPCTEHGEPPANTLVDIPAGAVTLGRSFDEPIYGWDNEYGTHRAEVPAFQAARYLVTNREYLGFVFDDEENLVPQLLANQGQPDKLAVFVAVTDDGATGGGEGEHGQQLRLGAGL